MIRGVHAMFYSSQATELRTFLRDKLKFDHIDVGGGWLIFDVPAAEVGVHPVDHSGSPEPGAHQISFYCDDVQKTVAELKGRGVEFTREIEDHGYGLTTQFKMPGNVIAELYQPKYVTKPRG